MIKINRRIFLKKLVISAGSLSIFGFIPYLSNKVYSIIPTQSSKASLSLDSISSRKTANPCLCIYRNFTAMFPQTQWFYPPPLDGWKWVFVRVVNEGDAPTFATYAEVLESCNYASLSSDIGANLSKCELRDRVGPVTLYPGQAKVIRLRFTRRFEVGQAIGLCYDPVFDPRRFPSGVGNNIYDRKQIGGKTFHWNTTYGRNDYGCDPEAWQ